MPHAAPAQLARLAETLVATLDDRGIRILFKRIGLDTELPGPYASLRDLADGGVDVLARRARIDLAFLTALGPAPSIADTGSPARPPSTRPNWTSGPERP